MIYYSSNTKIDPILKINFNKSEIIENIKNIDAIPMFVFLDHVEP